MRKITHYELERHRMVTGAGRTPMAPKGQTVKEGNTGRFSLPSPFKKGHTLLVTADDGRATGWEHVRVYLPSRSPAWEEMVYVRHLFWGDDEVAVEIYPGGAKTVISDHKYARHLWRKVGAEHPPPPRELVLGQKRVVGP